MRSLFAFLMYCQYTIPGFKNRLAELKTFLIQRYWWDAPTARYSELGATGRSKKYEQYPDLVAKMLHDDMQYTDRISFRYWWQAARAAGADWRTAFDVALWYGVFARVEVVA